MSTKQFEGLRLPSKRSATSHRGDPKIEVELEPLAGFMSKLVDLLEARGAEWSQQSPPQRVRNILQALQQL
jgi:hypothetical protein